jgi:hypothetical protein
MSPGAPSWGTPYEIYTSVGETDMSQDPKEGLRKASPEDLISKDILTKASTEGLKKPQLVHLKAYGCRA